MSRRLKHVWALGQRGMDKVFTHVFIAYPSLIPRPPWPHSQVLPSFSLLVVQKSGESLVSFSNEHDIIDKWQNEKVKLHIVQPTASSMLVVYDSHPRKLDTCGKLPSILDLLAVLSPSVP